VQIVVVEGEVITVTTTIGVTPDQVAAAL